MMDIEIAQLFVCCDHRLGDSFLTASHEVDAARFHTARGFQYPLAAWLFMALLTYICSAMVAWSALRVLALGCRLQAQG
jgi:hypothetical protein